MRQVAMDNLSSDETVCPKGYGTDSADVPCSLEWGACYLGTVEWFGMVK
jgi:hypothetical protein